MRSRRFLVVAFLALGALLLAACGDDSDSDSAATTEAPATTEATTTTEASTDTTAAGIDTAPYTLAATPATDLADGDTVSVEIGGYEAGDELTVVTCFVFPVVGPTDCDLSNYGDFTAVADDSGAATIDYTVTVGELDGGTCDADNPCFVVVGDAIGPDGNYAAQEVTFS